MTDNEFIGFVVGGVLLLIVWLSLEFADKRKKRRLREAQHARQQRIHAEKVEAKKAAPTEPAIEPQDQHHTTKNIMKAVRRERKRKAKRKSK